MTIEGADDPSSEFGDTIAMEFLADESSIDVPQTMVIIKIKDAAIEVFDFSIADYVDDTTAHFGNFC